MKNYSKKASLIIGSFLIASTAIMPAFAFAKGQSDHDNSRDDNHGNNNKQCLQAIGHFIAPGWIKHNGKRTIGEECDLPFGIGKRFGGEHPTTTPPIIDTTAPIINNTVALVGTTSVQISWRTNEAATTKVYYSTSTPVDITATSTASTENLSLVTSHSVNITGLATSTTYHMILESKDASNNVARSNEFTLTTSNGI